MPYTLKLFDSDDMPAPQRSAAEQRFRRALEGSLGDPALVLPMRAAYQRIVAAHGEIPDADSLSEAQRAVFEQWQAAESAAVSAAFGTHRYMGDAMYEIGAAP